ncbi:protein TolR [Xanthomonas translucens pv. arrhenatheri]|uniref:Tol-Pal system protein TolR n=3 Tax=Xanthomonas graminis TaxID=3390026 RepID=A0A0K2ZBQ1_9XANT|nr:protein TolR [Xanthomonas translucens]OAX57716.1 protein TolR [Xanthomonas translucens pv. poae]OAX64282.1 protein TolR [Xanthomonas translucens pv. arrhenatheri]UKE64859.1 protein TolR [Xanthomonas translucens pv. phlei]UKE74358.1 protein TolR [Xanthomonas translucens pv. phleipratensis]UKE76592.1 protein TolR [Xanthomonas translucens pv. arrhenatheri]
MTAAISRRKRRKLKSEINVVPYIDVMLVLLIIFMVTAPLLSLSVDVDLPDSTARSVESKKDPVIVTVDGEGRYTLTLQDGKPEKIGAPELKAKMQAFVSQNKDVPVFVAAPGSSNYQLVMDTMVMLQQAGVPKVGLMSQPGTNAR